MKLLLKNNLREQALKALFKEFSGVFTPLKFVDTLKYNIHYVK